METPARFTFAPNGSTKTFPIPALIKGDNYVRIDVDSVTINDRNKFDIVNNAVVFVDVADVPNGSQLDVLVVQTDEGIANLGATTSIDTVAQNITNVNTVATDIASVNTVATDIASVVNTSANIADVSTVAGSIGSVDAVSADIANVNTAAASIGNINTAATNIADIQAAPAAATAAEQSEINAAGHELVAGTHATNSANSATAAAGSASSASSSASAASSSASAALGSETNAVSSASSAATSESNAATSETNAANSASAASTSETNAATSASAASASQTAAAASETATAASETAAAASETAAAASETAAAASESAAAASESAAAASESAAAASETAAATSESNAATSETNAANSASSAATSATNAANSATNAATSATNASNSATAAANSATASASSATAASASADAALAALDSFDDRYLGQKTSDPTLDNDGNPLVSGALYFNTTDDVMKVYDGAQWVAAYASLSGAMFGSNNLSDVSSVSGSRANLGLGTAATTAATDYATAAQGALADSAVQPNDSPSFGSVTVSGTVNGRDVAVDGAKLDGIEAGATGDQTAAEIRALVEAAVDSNVFTDADHTKLNDIEANFAPLSHSHSISDVTGLQTELDAKLTQTQGDTRYGVRTVSTSDPSGGSDGDIWFKVT